MNDDNPYGRAMKLEVVYDNLLRNPRTPITKLNNIKRKLDKLWDEVARIERGIKT